MSKKLTNKLLMKTYYNLKLIQEVKQDTYKKLLDDPSITVEIKALILQDELEIERLINVFRDMVDVAISQTENEDKKMIDHLKQDPYYKLVQTVYMRKDKGKKDKSKIFKKIDKKLMN